MTSSKISIIRKEALIEGLIFLIIYFVLVGPLLLTIIRSTYKLDTYNIYIMTLVTLALPFLVPYIVYSSCKNCNFIYKDLKYFSFKNILFPFLRTVFITIVLFWYTYEGTDNFGEISLRKIYAYVYFYLCMSKMDYALTYKKLMSQAQSQ